MARYQGHIDLRRLPSSTEPISVTVEEGLHRASLAGLALHWDPAFASVAQREGVIALASGRSRGPTLEAQNEAQRWIERYAARGISALETVGGGFAGLIVDVGERRAFLFVDRFSEETVCYATADGTLAFADAAAEVPGGSRDLDPQSIYDYLWFHVIPAPQTVFRDVRRLLPANVLTATADRVETRAYWTPLFRENDRRDLAGRLRQFMELVQTAVEEEADEAATACFLSGGTDSSTVAGMLTRVRGTPAHAYSIGFEAEGYDEMEYARIAARHFGLAHHEYYVTPADLVESMPRVAASFDQPFGNSSVLPAYYCALRAREDGFTRMLAGDGGDELFGGNSRYATQKLFQLYEGLPAALRRGVLEPAATRWSLFRSAPGLRQIGGYVRHSRFPMPDRLETFNLLRGLGEDALLEPRFRSAVDPGRPLEQQRATWRAVAADSLVNRMLAYDWKYTLADGDLPKVRSATQLAGVSVGYPFLSRGLTDFSLALPPSWKVNGLRLRWFFKRALRDFLPAEILRKKKHGFGLPFGTWVLRHEPLRRLAEESLAGIAERGIVARAFAEELLHRRLPEAPAYYGEMVWILAMLEQWLKQHPAATKPLLR